MNRYAIELIGGRWDAQRGFTWREGEDDGAGGRTGPPPEAIFVGVCPGDGACFGGLLAHCRAMARQVGLDDAVSHPMFWTPEESTRPEGCERYVRRGEPVVAEGECLGHVVYVIGGLEFPKARGARAIEHVPIGGRDLVTAAARKFRLAIASGRHDRGWPK